MSWSRPLLILALAALLPLSACGFRPLYGKAGVNGLDTDTRRDLASVRILPIADRTGQQLRNALVERMSPRGEPVAAKWTLAVLVSTSMTGLGLRKDAVSTLGEMTVSATYTLAAAGAKTGGLGTSGTATAVVSVNFLGPRYGSVAAERDAEERAIAEIAENIREQVAVFLRDPAHRTPPPAAPYVPQ
jgi:LPS-assembly lipoprotein